MTARRHIAGFTLLESILAVTLIALVLGTVHTALWVSVRSYRASRERAADETTGVAAARLLDDDVSRLLPQQPGEAAALWARPDVGPGAGECLLRLRVAARPEKGQQDMRVDYFYVADEGGGSLLRRSEPSATGEGLPLDEDVGRYEIVAAGLAGAGFRYFDGSAWSDEWDADARGELPRLIEMTLRFPSGAGERTLRRTVEVAVDAPPLSAAIEEGP